MSTNIDVKEQDIYSTTEAGEVLGVGRATIVKHIQSGRLKARQMGAGGLWYIRHNDLMEFKHNRPPVGKPPFEFTKELSELYKSGHYTQSELADIYNVHYSTISKRVRGIAKEPTEVKPMPAFIKDLDWENGVSGDQIVE